MSEIPTLVVSSATRRLGIAVARIALTGFAQSLIQLLGFTGGLILVRMLPVHEYAYYTIANAILGTMTVLTDGGIAESVIAQGGKVWHDRTKLGGVIAAGLALRRRFAVLAVAASLPTLFFMLQEQGASVRTSILVSLSIVPLFASSLTGQLLEIAPRLHQRLTRLQTISLSSAGLRVLLVTGAASILPVAWLASLCGGVSQGWANWRVRRLAHELADCSVAPPPEIRTRMLRQIGRTFPSAVYYAFAGQITVWLISIFGSTQAVAQVGALGRLAAGFSVFSAVLTLIVMPRFARVEDGASAVHRYYQVQFGLFIVLVSLVLAIAAFPSAALAVLGHRYSGLTHEVVLAAAAGALTLMAGSAYAMAAARGIVVAPWIVIPFAIALQAVLAAVLPISTVAGVLWLGVLSNAAFWVVHTANFVRKSSASP